MDGTSWLLKTLNGRPPVSDRKITMNIEGGRVFGRSGCNSYSVGYRGAVDGRAGRFDIGGELIQSAVECRPEEIMALERSFMAVLGSADSYRIAGNKLRLKTAAGVSTAVFIRQRHELTGTWRVIDVEGASLLEGTSLSVSFGADRRISGSAGCNRYFGSYTASAERKTLSISPLSSTKRLCRRPDGIMMQEQRFRSALRSAVRWDTEDDRLILRNAAGSAAVSLSKAR